MSMAMAKSLGFGDMCSTYWVHGGKPEPQYTYISNLTCACSYNLGRMEEGSYILLLRTIQYMSLPILQCIPAYCRTPQERWMQQPSLPNASMYTTVLRTYIQYTVDSPLWYVHTVIPMQVPTSTYCGGIAIKQQRRLVTLRILGIFRSKLSPTSYSLSRGTCVALSVARTLYGVL